MSVVRFISGKAALEDFIRGIRASAMDRLEESKHNATRRLTNTLRTEVVEQPGATRADLFGAAHWKYVGNGRGPGKPPPIDPLVRWAKAKGLASDDKAARSFAHAVARTIAKEGTLDNRLGGKNVFAEVIREAQPKVEGVIAAFARDIDRPIATQLTKALVA